MFLNEIEMMDKIYSSLPDAHIKIKKLIKILKFNL